MLAVLVVLAEWVGLASLVVLVALAVWGGLAVLEAATSGSTIQHIAAAHPIEIAPQQTGLVARRAAILWPTVRLARGNRSADRVATCLATAPDPA